MGSWHNVFAFFFCHSALFVHKIEETSYFDAFGGSSCFVGISPAEVHNRDPRLLTLVVSGAKAFGDGVLAQAEGADVILVQMVPWQFAGSKPNLRRTYRRTTFLLSRLLANLGVSSSTPLLDRFHQPATDAAEPRWRKGLYLDQAQEWDDPYRFFRW